MSLTQSDLEAIRNIIERAVEPIEGELQALRNDIKDIYDMISDLQKSPSGKMDFEKLTLEKKILALYSDVVDAAKQAGVTLPKS